MHGCLLSCFANIIVLFDNLQDVAIKKDFILNSFYMFYSTTRKLKVNKQNWPCINLYFCFFLLFAFCLIYYGFFALTLDSSENFFTISKHSSGAANFSQIN